MDKINVKCMVNHHVSVKVPSVNFAREWMGKDNVQKIDKDILEQIMFDPGVRNMFNAGVLYIEEMEVKKEIGLEPEDATKPVNIIVLTDKQRREYLISKSFSEFTKMVDKLSIAQLNELADYAIKNKLIDFDRDEYIKSKCGRDIITAIKLNKQNEEA